MPNRFIRIMLLISIISGFFAVLIFRRNLAAEASMLNYFGFLSERLIFGVLSVDSIREIFTETITGFIYFDFFDIVHVALIALLFIPAIYSCYKRYKINAVISSVLLLGSLSMYIATNRALPLYFNLDNTEKLTLMVTQHSFYERLSDIPVFLFYSFGLFMTISIKRIHLYSNITFTLGIMTNIIGLLYTPLRFIVGEYSYYAIVIAAPFTVAWHIDIVINNIRLLKKR